MADEKKGEELEKRAVEEPAKDPIADQSMSGLLLVFSLLLIVTLIWALFDEVYGQRPWKTMQKQFVSLYTSRLEKIRPNQAKQEKEVKDSEDYQKLNQAMEDAQAEAKPEVTAIGARVSQIDQQVDDITPVFQDLRAKLAALTYQVEISDSASKKNSLRKQIDEVKNQNNDVEIHNNNGGVDKKKLKFNELETMYNSLRDEKGSLTTKLIAANEKSARLLKERDTYFQQHMEGLSDSQVGGLIDKMRNFKYEIKQINLPEANVVDRCESCHLGVREPVTLTKQDMGGREAFVSHPDRELLKIHDPERFGCSTCHGGNGRATTSEEKGHGRYEHWLWPLYYKENTEAGCNQCHNNDRVVAGADVLNRGKDLFQTRGCYGCHRYEGFDRETDALNDAHQTVKQLDLDRDGKQKEVRETLDKANNAQSDEEAQRLFHQADALRQSIANVDGQIDQLEVKAKYLMEDQKKFGPNLKDIKLKLHKEWIPVWLQDPQAFRPGTKMPSFRLEADQIKAISAFIWQDALTGPALSTQPQGDANHGKELFKTLGCLACHSIDGSRIDQGDMKIGGTFAADLSRVGEKNNYDYVVRWVHNPRERTVPYCPTEKRDLTPDDYAKHGLPFVFDLDHSKCPNDGREIQVQNMTVMPNFRMSDQDARDVATFLVSGKRDAQYPDASFMDDGSLKDQGKQLVRAYGCAACHEIAGLEDEQRIGTELTKEGSKPIERLDFALLTEDAEGGVDPLTGKKAPEPWYNSKGFFEHKLANPAVYDAGKEKEPQDRLKMPNIFLQDQDITALTTFLLGSVDTSLPQSMQYNPNGSKKDVQDGWWVVKKYNCMGCHNVLVGQDSVLMGLPMYQADAKEQLPPRLTTEGARVNPQWLLRFLRDPSLSDQNGGPPAKGTDAAALSQQPGLNRDGVRAYLKARMPTFNFSPNEVQALVNFFMGASDQAQPYIPEKLDPLAGDEQNLGRALFTSQAAPCLKCHMTGDAAHDSHATAPNFLLARERLKPDWIKRWVVDPSLISPGTSMPSGLFKRDATHDRWVLNGNLPPEFEKYDKDHVSLLVRYMFAITPEEQQRLSASLASSQSKAAASAAAKPTARLNGPSNHLTARILNKFGWGAGR
ncbi:MAG TPA: c-type cytochrome [Blastocatellia bacterium]|nr:c-type cytochrome [Blastocatellia bacterium]